MGPATISLYQCTKHPVWPYSTTSPKSFCLLSLKPHHFLWISWQREPQSWPLNWNPWCWGSAAPSGVDHPRQCSGGHCWLLCCGNLSCIWLSGNSLLGRGLHWWNIEVECVVDFHSLLCNILWIAGLVLPMGNLITLKKKVAFN
jgi:hypothetical protein